MLYIIYIITWMVNMYDVYLTYMSGFSYHLCHQGRALNNVNLGISFTSLFLLCLISDYLTLFLIDLVCYGRSLTLFLINLVSEVSS